MLPLVRYVFLLFEYGHVLLFLSPPHAALAGVVRAAVARFVKGSMIVMQLMVKGMEVGHNAMLPRYGVHSALDTPKLVFLDQRKDKSENRQVAYPGEITEEAVVDFLKGLGMLLADGEATDGGKDEL